MKKILILLITLFTGILAFGQDVIPPENWVDLYENYGVFLSTYLGVAGVAIFLGEYLIRMLKVKEKWQKVTLVFICSVGISFTGKLFNVGYLIEAVWYEVIIWGLLSGISANGLFSGNIFFLKSLAEFIIGLIKPKKQYVK